MEHYKIDQHGEKTLSALLNSIVQHRSTFFGWVSNSLLLCPLLFEVSKTKQLNFQVFFLLSHPPNFFRQPSPEFLSWGSPSRRTFRSRRRPQNPDSPHQHCCRNVGGRNRQRRKSGSDRSRKFICFESQSQHVIQSKRKLLFYDESTLFRVWLV